jgi:hypothetical protein
MTCRRRKKKCDEQHPACKFDMSSSSSLVPDDMVSNPM